MYYGRGRTHPTTIEAIIPSIDRHIRQQQYQPLGITLISTRIRVHHAQKYDFQRKGSDAEGGGTSMRNSDEWSECDAFRCSERQHTTQLFCSRNQHPGSSAPNRRSDGSHRSLNRSDETLINEWVRGQRPIHDSEAVNGYSTNDCYYHSATISIRENKAVHPGVVL